jgi:DNA-binding NarL/FixJ family response regulator
MRVVIAEDSVLLREGISRLLADDDISVVASVGDGNALLDAVLAHRPELPLWTSGCRRRSPTRACGPP